MAQQQNQQNSSSAGLFVVGASLAFVALAWVFAHDPLARALLFTLRVLNWPFATIGLDSGVSVATWLDQASGMVAAVTFPMVMAVAGEIGSWYRWPVGVVAVWFAWRAWQDPTLRATMSHDIQSLLLVHSRRWKAIVPFLNRDLTNDKRRAALSGAEYARKRKIVSGEQKAKELDVARATDALVADIGKAWQGPESLAPHEQALFAAFGLRVLRRRNEAGDLKATLLLDALNESARKTGKIDFSLARSSFDEVVGALGEHAEAYKAYRMAASADDRKAAIRKLRKLSAQKRLHDTIEPHGYAGTVLVAMAVAGIAFDGVLPPADFLWLKDIDRKLWYALNNAPVGGKLSFAALIEGAAILAQWQAEVVARRNGLRLTGPYTNGALKALKTELYETGVIDKV